MFIYFKTFILLCCEKERSAVPMLAVAARHSGLMFQLAKDQNQTAYSGFTFLEK